MKAIDLGNGKIAKCCVEYGNKVPQLDRPAVKPGQKIYQPEFKSVTIKVTVTKDGEEIGQFEGTSYCSPTDVWNRVNGRRYAIRKVFDQDTKLAKIAAAENNSKAKKASDMVNPNDRNSLNQFKVLDLHARAVLARNLLPMLFEEDETEEQQPAS